MSDYEPTPEEIAEATPHKPQHYEQQVAKAYENLENELAAIPKPAAAPLTMEQAAQINIPNRLTQNRRLADDRLLLAGVGPVPADIMLLATSAHEEQTEDHITGSYQRMASKPRYSKGPAWNILKDVLSGVSIDINTCYYTAVVKWQLPRATRGKPPKEAVNEMLPILDDEIRRVKPKIVVAFGKTAFDALVKIRLKFNDIQGCWFYSQEYNAKVFVMPNEATPIFKPEMVETFRINLFEISRMLDTMKDAGSTAQIPVNFRVINNSQELAAWVSEMLTQDRKIFSIDTEFGGKNHIDGKLRSFQIAWTDRDAVYIRFMDDQMQYVFDVSYADAGKILAPALNRPDARFIGHHISADWPWLNYWLGIEWYEKTLLDTEFAEQTLDENAELGAERISMKYTTLGRYDTDLIVWKSENREKLSDELGYLLVPDLILIPYAVNDVLVPMRALPIITRRLFLDKTYDYYCNFRNVLVGDLFTQFALGGLPVRQDKIDKLRALYSYCRELLQAKFIEELVKQARTLLMNFIIDVCGFDKGLDLYSRVLKMLNAGEIDTARVTLNQAIPPEHTPRAALLIDHLLDSPNFNMASAPQKSRWLFDVCKFKPVKTTANKAKGMPSVPWEKYLSLDPEVQKLYRPSADKQSIKIIGDDTGDPMVIRLLDVLAVSNVSKSFLKEPTIDEETGEVTRENGLFYWIARDGCLHGMLSVTETGRSRAWKPNVLNYPSYVHEGVKRGMAEVLNEQKKLGKLPPDFEVFLDPKKIPSVRSVIDVSQLPALPGSAGWCFVESDYNSAELRGLAYMSGDENMIRLLNEPDPQFGIPKDGDPEEDRVRLHYADDCGIAEINRRKDLIMAKASKGVIEKTYTLDELLRDADGNLVHPGHDLHWGLVELVMERPREEFDKKVHRTGIGKVGNFCIAEGEMVLTDRGPVAIEDVTLGDLLWDGLKWVQHEGVVEKGTAEVNYYQGLWATDNHTVWLSSGKRTTFGEARLHRMAIATTANTHGVAIPAQFENVENCSMIILAPNKLCRVHVYDEDADQQHGSKQAKIFDIINAGPRCRFTCSSLLVSNSSIYGANAGTLERKYKSDTGKDPEPGTGDKILDALEKSRPQAWAWLAALAEIPGNEGYWTGEAGDKRRFRIHDPHIRGISSRLLQSLLSALGRQARNYPKLCSGVLKLGELRENQIYTLQRLDSLKAA